MREKINPDFLELKIGHKAPSGVSTKKSNALLCFNEPKFTQFSSLLA